MLKPFSIFSIKETCNLDTNWEVLRKSTKTPSTDLSDVLGVLDEEFHKSKTHSHACLPFKHKDEYLTVKHS